MKFKFFKKVLSGLQGVIFVCCIYVLEFTLNKITFVFGEQTENIQNSKIIYYLKLNSYLKLKNKQKKKTKLETEYDLLTKLLSNN